MIKKLLSTLLILGISHILSAQIFTQDFSASTDLSTYISATPNSGQLSAIINNASVTSSISNGALRMVKSASNSSYFYRNPVPALSPTPKLLQFKFDLEVSQNAQTGNPIFFYFGPDFSATGTQLTEFHSRFGISISATSGNFALNVLDNGVTVSADFSGKQTITFVVNNSGGAETYTAPNGASESIANDKWELWVGTTRIFNEITARNPDLELGSFKMQNNSSVPLCTLDFDNFEMTSLVDSLPSTQSLVHPHIWASNADKQQILDNINNYSWASSMYTQLVNRQDNIKNIHVTNPEFILTNIPGIPGDRTTHRTRLNTAVECAMLYYLTNDEEYAQLAADILYHYVKLISVQDPLTFEFYSSTSFNHLIPPRELFPRVGITYDFIQPFLVKLGTTVYDLGTGTRVPFNFSTSQKAFEVMADNVVKVGANNSNHPVLELPGGLYSVMCMEDDAIRANFFDKLLNGAANSNQPGINWMLNRFSAEERLWPESAGYGKFTHALFIQLMNIVDQYRPDLNIIANNQDLLESIFIYENFLYPNGNTMAYGDIGREFTDHAHIFRAVLKIADRKGYTALKERAASTLKKIYAKDGGYNPVIETQTLEWNNPLQLLWGINLEASVSDAGEPQYGTVKATHAGVVMQRNYSGTNDQQNGLMYYTGGGTYVHAHATGLDLELYGAGYVIGPDYGSGTYGTPIHEEYAVSHAAHNTIIVNGATKRGTSSSGTWNNIVSPIVLQAIEPKVYANPIASNFSFSTQFLDDNINNVDQQRTNSIIRTSPISGYYVDIFRSVSNATNNYHDYLFHGLGDVMQINTGINPLSLTDTPSRYQNDIGDSRKQPGWRWYSNAKTSALTTDPVTARFDLQFDNKYLHVSVPGGVDKEYSSALAPQTKEVNNGYANKDTQMFIIRKYGEAWNEPFVAIYEPSGNGTSTIKSTENIYDNSKVVGVKVVSEVNGQVITDYVLSNDNDGVAITLTDLNIAFTGRFAIVRTEVKTGSTDVSLYIGKGQQITFIDETLTADGEGKAYLEYNLNYELSTNENMNFEEHIIAFPSPTAGSFEINVPKQFENIKIEVYNIHAQLIASKTHNVSNGKVTLDITDSAKGIYFVKVNLEKPVYVKVIKK